MKKKVHSHEPFQVYPMRRKFHPVEQATGDTGKVTAVIHTGGVSRGGIPAYVGVSRVIYVGGTLQQYGWRERYVLRDPDGGRRGANVDPTTGQRYYNSHDGFNGFMIAAMLDGLARIDNGAASPYDAPGPEFRRLMQDLSEALDTAMQQMVGEVNAGGLAKIDIGVLCRQGRHRSNGVASMIGSLLASAGFVVALACWDLYPGEYLDCFERRKCDERGPRGCRAGNCTFLEMDSEDRVRWNVGARRVGGEARARFVELAEHHIPQELLRGRLSAWQTEEEEPQVGGTSAAAPAAVGAALRGVACRSRRLAAEMPFASMDKCVDGFNVSACDVCAVFRFAALGQLSCVIITAV